VASLFTNGLRVTRTPAVFNQFDLIAVSTADLSSSVVLRLARAGALNIADALDARAAEVRGSSGSDQITTGMGADTLFAGAGDDTLRGGAGNDRLFGGTGNDAFALSAAGNGTDLIRGGDGFDRLILDGEQVVVKRLILDQAASVEELNFGRHSLVGTVGADHIDLSGVQVFFDFASETLGLELGSGNDYYIGNMNPEVWGGVGNDTLIGGAGTNNFHPGPGADLVEGNGGTDAIILETSGRQRSTFYGGEGQDSVWINAHMSLRYLILDEAASIEHLEIPYFDGSLKGTPLSDIFDFSGVTSFNGGFDFIDMGAGRDLYVGGAGQDSVYGGAGNDTLAGGAGTDFLLGGDGDDRLDGGAGNDHLFGGAGRNTYVIDSVGDEIDADDPGEFNSIETSLAFYHITAMSHVWNLTGTYVAGGFYIGNDNENVITGNTGNDTLQGKLGEDTLIGGAGNDEYRAEIDDVIVELVTGGVDTVVCDQAEFTLTANIENLTMTSDNGVVARGNGANNTIITSYGDDTIDGLAGEDRMIGHGGDDIYIVQSVGDVVVESKGGGLDAVGTDLQSYTLGANVDFLVGASDGGQVLTGNGLRNGIQGGSGNDTINGWIGADFLRGGLGNDVFVFSAPLLAADKIEDFATVDTIRLVASAGGPFVGLALGVLDQTAFRLIGVGGLSLDADDRILYESSTGKLYYDADGSGSAAQIWFATLTNHASISAADFSVV
jgi:Ca2+-binding RTX toxin-like protein